MKQIERSGAFLGGPMEITPDARDAARWLLARCSRAGACAYADVMCRPDLVTERPKTFWRAVAHLCRTVPVVRVQKERDRLANSREGRQSPGALSSVA